MIKPKHYRPSASLIIAARQSEELANTDYDYKLLLIKRSAATAYANDHCVFPGGAYDAAADESAEWLKYFHTCGVTHKQLQQLIIKKQRPVPLMTSGRQMSRDISLRLTAIRETFEEVGLLLYRKQTQLKNIKSGQPAQYYEQRHDIDLVYWQRRVHQDAKEFLNLCRILQIVPDLWALSEWSIWRSPATSTRKFDTIYYFAALALQPTSLLLEPSETQAAMWYNPVQCLTQFKLKNIWLPHILYYEISRLSNMQQWHRLVAFAAMRCQHNGSTLLQPTYYHCNEGMVGVLPGDSLYVIAPEDTKESFVFNGDLNDIRSKSPYLHRFIIFNLHELDIECNIPNLDAHLSPLRAKQMSKPYSVYAKL